jgi:Isocitrate/isopropylmalate dehydrogenase
VRPIRAWAGLDPVVTGAEGADFVIVRENTEGEYSGVGGRVHAGRPDEVATDVTVHARRAIERVARSAFELARQKTSCMRSRPTAAGAASPHQRGRRSHGSASGLLGSSCGRVGGTGAAGSPKALARALDQLP